MASDSLCIIFHNISLDDIFSLKNENINFYTIYKLSIDGDKAVFQAIFTTVTEDQQQNENFQFKFQATIANLDNLLLLTSEGIKSLILIYLLFHTNFLTSIDRGKEKIQNGLVNFIAMIIMSYGNQC